MIVPQVCKICEKTRDINSDFKICLVIESTTVCEIESCLIVHLFWIC